MTPFLPQSGRVLLRLAVCCAFSLGLSGCQGMNGMANRAQLRVIDATPDAGALDVYSADGAVAYNLGFGTATSYVPVSAAMHTLSTESAGTRTVMVATKSALASGKQYTLVVGNVAAGLQSTLLVDQSTPVPFGQSAVRFVNEAASSGALDLYLLRRGDSMAEAVSMGRRVGFAANTGYVAVPAGIYAVVAVPAGAGLTSRDKSDAAAKYLGPSQVLTAGSARTVVMVDQTGVSGTSLRALVASDYEPAAVE